MKLLKLAMALGFLSASHLYAKTWIAICNDGKNIQYNQTENGTGFFIYESKRF